MTAAKKSSNAQAAAPVVEICAWTGTACAAAPIARFATAPAGTELTITVWLQGRDGASEEVTLTCDPPGGTHPRPEEACLALEADPSALEPLPPDSVCTQIYGGPEEAEVVGTLDGEQGRYDYAVIANGRELDPAIIIR